MSSEKAQPLVSVITPTYNHERFIGRCIEGVLAQTYPHWEQIIVDDGSTDRTEEVVSKYDDERIKYIRQNNMGIWNLGKTYNKALECSRGELIAILEGDDLWPPRKLEKQLTSFERDEVIVSFGHAAVVDGEGEILGINRIGPEWFALPSKKDFILKLLFRNPITSCTAICRRSALVSIGGFKQPELVPYVDGPTWLELSLIGEFCPVDEMLGCYRHHERQVTATMRREMIEAGRYAVGFFTRLPPEIKESLSSKELDDVSVKLKYKLAESFYQTGRISLREGRWEEAKENFKEAIKNGRYSTKLKALLGLICSNLRTDLELAAAVARNL
jgi:glycosyltransferase involved in cell wall biosynthesis